MDLPEIFALADGLKRTAALVGWIQRLYGNDLEVPVLVGGGAVELYTGGAYVTGDLDFVGLVSPRVASALAQAGFVRSGRHWIHEAGQVFVEFPGDSLKPPESCRWLEVAGERLRVVAVEDLLVDRLGSWQYWKSSVDGVNAWLLWRARNNELDIVRLESRVTASGWEKALSAVRALAIRLAGREPSAEELEQWAMQGP